MCVCVCVCVCVRVCNDMMIILTLLFILLTLHHIAMAVILKKMEN